LVHSVEQSKEFHVARRIAAVLAPGWRLLATPQLEVEMVAVDLRLRTIEFGEGTGALDLIAGAMFSIGQIRQRDQSHKELFFGRGIRRWAGTDEELIDKLADQGAMVDRSALIWARRVLDAFWPESDFRFALEKCARRYSDWHRYFSAT
jgi:hypothetical protein